MIDLKSARQQLHDDLGYRPLHRGWAKVEILLGLLAVGLGQLAMLIGVRQGGQGDWGYSVAGLLVVVLGGYLALAGQRSHLYQLANEHTAYLVEQWRRLKNES